MTTAAPTTITTTTDAAGHPVVTTETRFADGGTYTKVESVDEQYGYVVADHIERDADGDRVDAFATSASLPTPTMRAALGWLD